MNKFENGTIVQLRQTSDTYIFSIVDNDNDDNGDRSIVNTTSLGNGQPINMKRHHFRIVDESVLRKIQVLQSKVRSYIIGNME